VVRRPSLLLRGATLIPRIELPHVGSGQERSAFARGPQERRLRIVVDRATAAKGDPLNTLLMFGHHPLIELLSTRAEGLPRVEIGPIDKEQDDAQVLVTWPDGSTLEAGVDAASSYIARAERYVYQNPSSDRDAILNALLLAAASRELGVDAVVTGSRVLLDPDLRDSLARESNAMRPKQAIALMGLYLRLRENFTYDHPTREPWRLLDRHGFYWVLTRELLPSGWRLVAACQQHFTSTGQDDLLRLSFSALTRLDRSLRARDRLQEQLKLVQRGNTADEALFYLDTFSIFFVSAFDAIAHIANIIYGVSTSPLEVGWRRPRWLKKLSKLAPTLASLVDKGTPTRDALDLLALLRNTVHGEALRAFATSGTVRPLENLVLLPKAEQASVLDIVSRRGGNVLWGVRPSSFGMALQADTFVEAVLPRALRTLNKLIAAIDVERLSGVQLNSLPTGPPQDGPSEFFNSRKRRQVRHLAGLA
jgi:hypothetical protein